MYVFLNILKTFHTQVKSTRDGEKMQIIEEDTSLLQTWISDYSFW